MRRIAIKQHLAALFNNWPEILKDFSFVFSYKKISEGPVKSNKLNVWFTAS